MYFLCRTPYANRAIVDNKNCKMIKENNSKMQLGLSLVNLFVVYSLFAVADHLRLFVFLSPFVRFVFDRMLLGDVISYK